jgi:hypothetical protein
MEKRFVVVKRLRCLVMAMSAMACISMLPTVSAAQGILPFKSRELAEGRNFIQRQTALLAVGEAAGSVSYDFDFQLPPANLVPSLSLQ